LIFLNKNLPDFYNRFQQLAKVGKGFLKNVLLSHLVYSQIWLSLLVDDEKTHTPPPLHATSSASVHNTAAIRWKFFENKVFFFNLFFIF
jgi:hypothetical protein